MVVEAIALTSMLIGWPHAPNVYEERGVERAVARYAAWDGAKVKKADCASVKPYTAAQWYCSVRYRGKGTFTEFYRVKAWEDGSVRIAWSASLWPVVKVEPKR